MLRQAREALVFAQRPAAVANVRQVIKSTEGALRTAKRRLATQPGGPFRRPSEGPPTYLLAAEGEP